MTSNKQNSEGEYIISSDHSRTQELNLSNCLNQVRQGLEDAYRLANGGVTKKQSKVDKIKRNNDRNRRRRAKKEALLSSSSSPLSTTPNISKIQSPETPLKSTTTSKNSTLKLQTIDSKNSKTTKTISTKVSMTKSFPTEETQFSPSLATLPTKKKTTIIDTSE